ncbi:MAG: DUF3047 domain-containing protein [Nitrospirae bacterium]|nr:DUF3047 domain-containing protein [Nitrospirota bacterium]
MKFFRFLILIGLLLILSAGYLHGSIVADITPDRKGNIPKGWELKEWNGKADILIENENGSNIFHLKSSKSSFALHKELKLNLKEYPIIRWKWKVARLPDGGDVRNKKMDDQAAQLYVVFPRFPAMVNSRVIGYIWESSAPSGSITESKKRLHTKYIVLQSGKERLGEWIEEKRNVYADYKMLFNEEPPPVGKISIMIDSDDTKSSAESFFSEIIFEKEPFMLAEAPRPAEKEGAGLTEEKRAGKTVSGEGESPVAQKESEVKKEENKKIIQALKGLWPKKKPADKEAAENAIPEPTPAEREQGIGIYLIVGIPILILIIVVLIVKAKGALSLF